MKLGISTACYFQKTMIEGAIPDIRAHGVPLCELFLNTLSEYEPDFFSLLSDRVNETGIRVYSVHPMSTQFEPQLFSIHPRQRSDAWSLYERVLRGGRQLGASVYVMHGPVHLSGAAKNIQFDRIAPIFQELSALAASYGITLALENVSWCVFHTPEFGRQLRSRPECQSLKYTLDIKQALRSGYEPMAFIDAVGPDIVDVHLCDVMKNADGSLRLKMPGLGNVDFAALLGALEAKGAKAAAFLEVYSDMYDDPAELYESYARMRKIFSK